MQADKRRPLHELARFCIVGLGSVLFNNLVIIGFTELLGFNYLASIVIAFVLATLIGFGLNRRWSFQKDGETRVSEIIRYFAVTLCGLGASLLAVWYFMQIGIPYYVSMIGIASLMAPVNFLAHRIWSFDLRAPFGHEGRAR